MRYPTPAELLRKHGLKPKKAWGQNFIADTSVLDRIVDVLAPKPGDTVVELGAGLGHLTHRLGETGARVIAVERDRDLIPVLEASFADTENVEVRAADAKKFGFDAFEGPVAVVGNLPYQISTPILFHLLEHRAHLSHAVLMLQREVADRLAAGPGTKARGILSVRFQLWADVEKAFEVPSGAFIPAPGVTGAVVRFDFRAEPLADPGPPDVFERVVAVAFGQRRKTLQNSLKAGKLLPPPALAEAIEEAGIDPKVRAERLSVAEFAALARSIGARQ